MTQLHAGIASNVIPARAEATINFRYAPDRTRRVGGRANPRALARRRDRLQLATGACGAALAARRAAAKRRRPRRGAEAGLDECGRLRGTRSRRGQLRARRNSLCPRRRRAGRDRRAGADVLRSPALSRGYGLSVQLSPVLADLAQYPFARLDDWKADASARGIELIDFGMGDPRERTPAFIRQALLDSVDEVSSYPRAPGLPELRSAIAGWIGRRFGVEVDPDREIVPTLGSKEAIYSFAQLALGEKRLVAIPEPAYPVYERGALFAGGVDRQRPPARGARLAPRPRCVRRVGRDRALLGLLPEQSDRRRGSALVLRGARPPGRASTASCCARTRPTRSSGSTSRRSRRCRSPTGRTSSSSTRSRSARR